MGYPPKITPQRGRMKLQITNPKFQINSNILSEASLWENTEISNSKSLKIANLKSLILVRISFSLPGHYHRTISPSRYRVIASSPHRIIVSSGCPLPTRCQVLRTLTGFSFLRSAPPLFAGCCDPPLTLSTSFFFLPFAFCLSLSLSSVTSVTSVFPSAPPASHRSRTP